MTFLPKLRCDPLTWLGFALQGPDAVNLPYKYFFGIANVIGPTSEARKIPPDELCYRILNPKLTMGVVSLLDRNQPPDHAVEKGKIQAVLQGTCAAMPVTASSLGAMTIAFFAENAELHPKENPSLLLITLRMDSLLDGVRPISNPLGSFWLPKVDHILEQLKNGKAIMTAESFEMVAQQTQVPLSHASLLADTQATGLEGKMERIEADIELYEDLLSDKKAELAEVRNKLRRFSRDKPGESEGGDGKVDAPLPVERRGEAATSRDAVESS